MNPAGTNTFKRIMVQFFLPYQHKHFASDRVDEETGAEEEENDQVVDKDGIRPSQLRDRFERNIPLDEW